MARRIRRPKNKNDLFNQLRKSDEQGIFDTYKDVLVFSAAVGYKHNRRVPFDYSDEPIDWDIFKSNDRALINMIALSVTDDLNILSEEEDIFDKRLKIFEEYANGGLEIMGEKISSNSSPLLDTIIDLLLAAESSEDQQFQSLGQLVKELKHKSE